ncbi:MAG: hypothetical protein IJ035_09910, partial [Oscillospiraceae bacterium]|nr:hypothetical protein [Oscillospiraceae bacterium]
QKGFLHGSGLQTSRTAEEGSVNLSGDLTRPAFMRVLCPYVRRGGNTKNTPLILKSVGFSI